MKIIPLFVFVLFSTLTTQAQEKLPCGTRPSQKQIDRINKRMQTYSAGKTKAAELSNVAISAHILRQSDGTGGLGESDFNDAITVLNGFYANANMKFFALGGIHYIDDDSYYNFDADDESVLGAAHDVDNTINIYFANSVASGEDPLCGYAYFSGGPNRVVMDNECALNGSTLAHEIGHFFDLYHTHGKTNTGTTDELVDGSNCNTAGDNICDTPADPKLGGDVIDNGVNCNYVGTAVDANDQEYSPDTGNIMSYSLKACRAHFSTQQYNNIANTYATDRNYLISKSLVADFDADATTICSGKSITYEDKSISPVSWAWEFPGGTPTTSDLQNPTITYETSGTYHVTLTITNDADETDVKTFTNFISVEDPAGNPPNQLAAGFETGEGVLYTIENEDGDDTYLISSNASSQGSKSMLMKFLSYDRIGEEDYLILDDVDLSGDNLYRLSFDRAYAYYDKEFKDSLTVLVAESCSNNWELFRAWSPDNLATASPHTLSFVPENSEWKNEQLLIDFNQAWESARVAFKTINGFGNNLYLDQINLKLVETDLAIQDIVVGCSTGASDGTVEVLTTASGTLSYSLDGENYQEGNTFSHLSAGDYKLYISQDGDLVETDEFSVLNAANIGVEVTLNEKGDLEAISEAIGFQWYFDGEEIAGATTSTLSFQNGGTYFVVVTTQTGCSAKSKEFVITGIGEANAMSLIYPNPVNTEINVELFGPALYEIIDLSGKRMSTGKIISNAPTSIDVQGLSTGMYLIRIKTDQEQFQRKFQKL